MPLIVKTIKVFINYYCNYGLSVEIQINKNLPLNRGFHSRIALASSVIIGLMKLTGKEFNFGDLESLCLSLHPLITWYLKSDCAQITGRGDDFSDLNLNLKQQIIIIPASQHKRVSIPQFEFNQESVIDFGQIIIDSDSKELLNKVLMNDLEDYFFAVNPELKQIKDKMISIGADIAMLNGYGSSIVALFPLEFNLIEINSHFPDHKIYLTNQYRSQ